MAKITKILEGTLPTGNTTVSFTDSDIPNSLIRVYATNADVFPASITLSGNTLTITYQAQSSTLYIAVELVKAGLEVIDDVTSDDADAALSAKQGKYLKGLIDAMSSPTLSELADVNISAPADGDIIVYSTDEWVNTSNNITNLNDVEVVDIEDGQVLAWNEDDSVFKNVDMSSGGMSYSTTESVIGTWIDGSKVYRKVFTLTQTYSNVAQNTWTAINEIDDSNILQCLKATLIVFGGSTGPTVRVNYDLLTSTNRTYFNNKLAIAHYRPSQLTLEAGNLIILEYTKITD